VRLKFWRRGLLIAGRLISYTPRRKQLATGGAVIALVGADGAGKSTAVAALYKWLSKSFAVHQVHLGKPPQSMGVRMTPHLWRGIMDARGRAFTCPPGAAGRR
jgi:predicted GTPase